MGQKFKRGDRVRIRAWEDMVAEYGVDELGDIDTGYLYFAADMKILCGTTATVRGYDGRDVDLDDWDCDEEIDTDWCFCEEMLELVKD